MAVDTTLHGTCAPGFEAVRDAFAASFARGEELGAAVAVTCDGRSVVDLWGGHADVARTRPWQRDTIVQAYSTTKAMTALCAHVLVDRRQLDLDAPVARYWPEFAQAGKAAIPVRWLLSHRAGLPAIRRPLPPEAVFDWQTMTAALAAETPWWEPGTRHGYHIMTFGWLVGEVVRRVSGRSLGTFLRDEVCRPLGADFFVGVPEAEDARAAEVAPIPPPPADDGGLLARALADPESMLAKTFFNPLVLPDVVNSRAWRAAEIPSVNGHTTARALARVYGALARGGEVDGVRLLGPATLAHAVAEQASGPDVVTGEPGRLGLGFMLTDPAFPFGPNADAFGHPGAGGAVGFADPTARVGFGYTPSRLAAVVRFELDPRAAALIDTVYASLR